MCNKLEVIQWLNDYFDNTTNFSREEINVVTDFSLLWNLFESKLAERANNGERLSVNYIRLSAIATQVSNESNHLRQQNFYESFLHYFRERYVAANNTTNDLFEGLRIRQPDIKNKVRKVLIAEEQAHEKVIESILIIIYRFRNNLFHGEKDLHNIHSQYENFKIANAFLMKVIEMNKKVG